MTNSIQADRPDYSCQICGHHTSQPSPHELGEIHGNTERFHDTVCHLWKCPKCMTIYNTDPVDFADIYSDYALSKRRLDFFARATSKNLLRRLKKAGLQPKHTVLEFGCGGGVFLQFLREAGYQAEGYDPYVAEYSEIPEKSAPFDCIVNNDTIEHTDDVRENLRQCLGLLKPGGLLYIGTPDSRPVNMQDLSREGTRLHQPFHRIIFTEETLHKLGDELGTERIAAYSRSYHDTLVPYVNYRFLDELTMAVDNNLDKALDPKETARVISRTPKLWFYGLFGYFFPSAIEPAVILRKPT